MTLLRLMRYGVLGTLLSTVIVQVGDGQIAAQNAPAGRQPLPPPSPQLTPEQLAIEAASEKDHQRVMDELGIKKLRPAVNSDPNAPNAANYDESKADVYTNIPDPLRMNDGTPVTSAEMWWAKRRPEIVEMFDREIYGRQPAHLPGVTWRVVKTEQETNGEFPVVTKTLVGHVDNSADPQIKVNIELTLSTPANSKGPVPVIMELGYSKEFLAMLAKRFPQFAQQAGNGPTWQRQVLAKGWGYAEYIPTSVQPDNGAGLTEGIIGLTNKGQPRKLDDWGSMKAWAWGASRCLDYFETDKDVDARQVGIEGHSRYGKATLVTMAYDPRFAVGYISSSGEAGAKLYRHIFGEQVGNVAAANEYHWMAGNFLKYAGPLTPGDLPVDNHELIALCAPKPVFISGGATNGADGWLDPKGMFMAAVDAGPVYRLLGKKDMGTAIFPPIETALIDGDIAFRQHSGGHVPGPNWPTFITFADRYLQAPGIAASRQPSPEFQSLHLTAEQDRTRTLGLLGLKETDLRPRPDSDPKSPHAANYDESKSNVYPNLPNPLVFKSGQPVKTPGDWSQRRKEIRDDFEREVLGLRPVSFPGVEWHVVSTRNEKYGGVDVVTKRLEGRAGPRMDSAINVKIDLLLTTPANAKGPVPLIMELAFDKDFQNAISGPLDLFVPGPWGVDGKPVVQRGWGFAILNPVSYQADDGAGLTEGIIGLINRGQPRTLDDWGVLSAWAWGASRALDYFEMDKSVDAKHVGLAGHSRFGKTALVTLALDNRFAIAYSSSSGEGGAKLYRHIFGEQIPNLEGPGLYHWMSGNFMRYAGPLTPGDLSVDNHELIALCAPRPVFIGGGASTGDGYANPSGDAWADTRGMFLAEVAAGPVYRLLGKTDLGTTEFPPVGTALVSGDLAFRQHSGGHLAAPNWADFLKYASRYLEAPQAAVAGK
jgi:hypothetical protein